MTPERLRAVERLFHEARERTPAERDAFLARACAGDSALRREVESLLAHAPAGAIDEPPGALAAELVTPSAPRLTPGSSVGPYRIERLLGVGGMGEVYRARDSQLDRNVAIKILPEAFASDAERVARFRREARVLASLNHPHIAAIYGFEDSDGGKALVMELVEGEDLAHRLARGALPLDEALPMAKQIAEALEAAHEQGIIHRDLKPANIKVRPDGTVKVLDFGLAKALDAGGSSGANPTTSPTISVRATASGMILGTAAYMSPEQARGRVVDARADIWAFGCVLYEMVTGTRAFKTDDVTDTMVAVLSQEPDWQKLPATASAVRPLLARCLKKDPKQRLQAIGDARIQIEELINGTWEGVTAAHAPAATPRRSVRRAAPAIASLVGGAIIGALTLWAMTRPAPVRVLASRFEIVPPPPQSLAILGADRDIAISSDGRSIGYRADGGQLVVRAIDRLDSRPLAGITNARDPFFSPDGQWIGFFDGVALKKAPTAGGSPITIWKELMVPRGASWGDDNSIVFARRDSAGLLRVPASGGEPAVLIKPDSATDTTVYWYPSVLPHGRGVLFTITAPNQAESAQVAVLDLKTGQRKTLIRGGSQAEYVSSGHLVYAAAGTLRAVRFDLDRLEVLSDPVPVVEDLLMGGGGAANYTIARAGTLVYVPASAVRRPRSLVWMDRNGQESAIGAPARIYYEPRLSPDATRVALSIGDQQNDIWIWDLRRAILTPLTFDPGIDDSPVWTPDGRHIVFASQRGGAGAANLFMQAADGTGVVQRLTTSADDQTPAWMAPDGSGVVGWEVASRTKADIVWFPLGKSRSDAEPLVRTAAMESQAEISPDGRYLAYQSNESGRFEIYVRPYPRVNDGRWQVSTDGGTRPLWARNQRELFYVDSANVLIAVPVQTSGATFAAGNPAKLFETPRASTLGASRDYDVTPDGQRFLMIKERAARDGNATTGMIVVLNWVEELKAKVAAVQ